MRAALRAPALLALALLALAFPGRPAAAEGGAGKGATKAPTVAEAADAALSLVKAADAAGLKALAARDDPDPWLVAEELLARGAAAEAAAFAKAAPRKDVEALPAYLAGPGKGRPDAKVHAALADAAKALAGGRAAESLKALAAAAPPEGTIAAVRVAHARGLALTGLGRLPESRKAHDAAAAQAGAMGWLAQQAEALKRSCYAAWDGADFSNAMARAEECLKVHEARGDRRGRAYSILNVGNLHLVTGNLAEALPPFEAARKLFEESGDREGLAMVLGNLGLLHQDLSDFAKARACLEEALKIAVETGDRQAEGRTLGNLVPVLLSLGDAAKALAAGERALAIGEEIRDPDVAATARMNLGNVHRTLRDYDRALDCYERGRKGKLALGDQLSAAQALLNIGAVHHDRGDLASAAAYFERARAAFEAIGHAPSLAGVLSNLGVLYEGQGDYARALSCLERALAIEKGLGMPAGLSRALGNLGRLLGETWDLDGAAALLEQSLAIKEEKGILEGLSSVAGILALVRSRQGRPEDARRAYDRSLSAAAKSGDPVRLASARAEFAGFLSDSGDHAGAVKLYGESVAALEKGGDAAAAAAARVNLGIEWEKAGDPAKALEAHTRALAEAERLALPRLVVHALVGMARSEDMLGRPERAVAAAAQAVDLLPGMLGGLPDEQGAGARYQYLDAYEVGLSASAALGDPAKAATFLEGGRAASLLESLHARDAIREVALPAELRKAEIDAAAGETAARDRLQDAVAAGNLRDVRARREELDAARAKVKTTAERVRREARLAASLLCAHADSVEALRGHLRKGEAMVLYGLPWGRALALVVTPDAARLVKLGETRRILDACEALAAGNPAADAAPAAAALRALLVAPLALGPEVRTVLVGPDGALAYLPFSLLFGDLDVACIPSGTTYGLLAQERGLKGEGVLAVGDPEYGGTREGRGAALHRGLSLTALPATRVEAKAVGTTVLLGEEATEAGLAAALAGGKRWRAVHLACHGLVDAVNPSLSALALCRGGKDDGLLTAVEVFRMRIPADLAVLSACETGRGKVLRGEGVVGLTRAFMFAGCPRVVVSLWKVDDEATRVLMTEFHRAWGAGEPAAAALRRAQARVRSEERWKHPAFWAGWVLWGLPD